MKKYSKGWRADWTAGDHFALKVTCRPSLILK